MKRVFLSVITYNSHESTYACLQSLDALTLHEVALEIYVVDNASKEPFSLHGKTYKHIVPTVIHSKINTGFSGGHNIVIRKALEEGADYVLVLNNDVTVDTHLVQALVEQAESDPQIGIVCPKIYFTAGSEFHNDRYTAKERGKVIWYAGGEMDWQNLIGLLS